MSGPRHLLVRPRTGEIPTVQEVTSRFSSVTPPGGDRPIVSLRINTNGKLQRATGDTGSALIYEDTGWWLNTDAAPVNAADWEVKLTVDSSSGAAATYTGDTLATFLALSSTRTFTVTKDTNAQGSGTKNLTIDLRQVSDTSNSDSKTGFTHIVQIDN